MKTQKRLPLFMLMGFSGSGKDELANALNKLFGWKKVKSVATRKPRYEGEDTYYFLTEAEYDAANLVQHAHFSGCRYGATMEEVDSSDIFVICPEGIPELMQLYTKRPLVAIFLDTTDETRRIRMKIRGDSDESIETRITHDAAHYGEVPTSVVCHRIDANGTKEEVLQKALNIIRFYQDN